MRGKIILSLEHEEQLEIAEFGDLVRFICEQDGEDCSKCYFKPLCPNCVVDVVDSFCKLWNERETLKVEKDE